MAGEWPETEIDGLDTTTHVVSTAVLLLYSIQTLICSSVYILVYILTSVCSFVGW